MGCWFHLKEKINKLSCKLLAIFTVKLLRAMAAGILIRKYNYPRIQAKTSAGTDCLRFPRVTGGNLPAPAGNLREAFIIRVKLDFFKPRDISFHPIPNTLTKVTTCCLWSQWLTLQIWFCSKKVGLFLFGSSNRYPKKTASWKSLQYHQNDGELVGVTFPVFSLIPSEGKMVLNSTWNTVHFWWTLLIS